MRGLLALAFALVLALGAPLASAHAELVRASPPAEARVATGPTSLDLSFGEGIEPLGSSLRVTNATGAAFGAAVSFARAGAMHAELTAPLPNGSYVVAWRALSEIDGHTTQGAYVLLVGANATRAGLFVPVPTEPPFSGSTLESAGRALAYGATMVLVGLPLVVLYVAPPGLAPVSRSRLRTLGLVAAIALAVGSLVAGWTFATRAAEIARSASGAASFVLWTHVGATWLARLAASLVALAAIALARRAHDRALFAAVGAAGVAAALAEASTSHAAALALPNLGLATDVVHLLSAAAWLGGLPALLVLVASERKGADVFVARFGALALVAVGLSAITGFALALALFRTAANLWTTAFGLALLAKLAIGVGLVVLGAVNRTVLAPQRSPRVARVLAAEVATALAFVVAVALLTAAAPPSTLASGTGPSAPYASERTVDGLTARLTLAPGPLVAGFHDYDVRLSDAATGARANAKNVTLLFAPLGGKGSTATLVLAPRGAGEFTGEGSELSASGPWRIDMLIERADLPSTRAAFEVNVS